MEKEEVAGRLLVSGGNGLFPRSGIPGVSLRTS